MKLNLTVACVRAMWRFGRKHRSKDAVQKMHQSNPRDRECSERSSKGVPRWELEIVITPALLNLRTGVQGGEFKLEALVLIIKSTQPFNARQLKMGMSFGGGADDEGVCEMDVHLQLLCSRSVPTVDTGRKAPPITSVYSIPVLFDSIKYLARDSRFVPPILKALLC